MQDAKQLERIRERMERAGVSEPAIRGFVNAVRGLLEGNEGWVRERDIEPVGELPRLEGLPSVGEEAEVLLRQLVVVNLNGGLGTSMGLDRAKSLIEAREGRSFLELITRQVAHLRERVGGRHPAFCLMNSFNTREDTLRALEGFGWLQEEGPVDFVQSRAPKLVEAGLEPVRWPADPRLEWCPPGHGDFYASIAASGMLERLLGQGIRYAFVSNADNLGSSVDLRLLGWMDRERHDFVMEVADRTAADRKGGHLAVRRGTGRLMLRESAQCPAEEREQFQDTDRHRYFNTNNLWIRLDRLRELLERHEGALPLPVIQNRKPVDPQDPSSPTVLQIESAMGAAIEHFGSAAALVVPRSRFAPVKTLGDLLAVRSDAYELTADGRVVLRAERGGRPPVVTLDPAHYHGLAEFEARFPEGAPSLVGCGHLTVRGPVQFAGGVSCEGDWVEFVNEGEIPRQVPSGVYREGRHRVG